MASSRLVPYAKELRIALRAARQGGRILMEHFGKKLKIQFKTDEVNYVTKVDRASEKAVLAVIQKAFPQDDILAEESDFLKGRGAQEKSRRWIIDPLDGTTNYIHHFPMFAVSIALEVEGDMKVGVVWDPLHKEMFHATRKGGAFLNKKRIRVTKQDVFRQALAGTGFPFREKQQLDRYLRIFKKMSLGTCGIRRPGSAALDLAYLACGRIDLFWEFGLAPWDVAAAALMIEEAGGKVSDTSGGPDYLSGNIVATNGLLHFKMLSVVKTK